MPVLLQTDAQAYTGSTHGETPVITPPTSPIRTSVVKSASGV